MTGEDHLRDDARFAENVRRERERAGWSQAEFARLLQEAGLAHFHQTTVSRVENGERPVRLGEARVIAKTLGTRVSLLIMPDAKYAPIQEFAEALDAVDAAHRALRSAADDIDARRWLLGYHLGFVRELLGEGDDFWEDSADPDVLRTTVESKLSRASQLVEMTPRDVLAAWEERLQEEAADGLDPEAP